MFRKVWNNFRKRPNILRKLLTLCETYIVAFLPLWICCFFRKICYSWNNLRNNKSVEILRIIYKMLAILRGLRKPRIKCLSSKHRTFQNVSLKWNKNKRCKKGATIDMLQIAYASQVLTSFVHGVHRMHKYELEKYYSKSFWKNILSF